MTEDARMQELRKESPVFCSNLIDLRKDQNSQGRGGC